MWFELCESTLCLERTHLKRAFFQAVTAHKMARIYTKTSLVMGLEASKRPQNGLK